MRSRSSLNLTIHARPQVRRLAVRASLRGYQWKSKTSTSDLPCSLLVFAALLDEPFGQRHSSVRP